MCRRAAPTSKTVNREGALKVLWRRITHRATPPPMCQSPPIPPPPLCPPFPQTPPFHSAPHGALPLLLPKISAYLSSKSALRVPLSASRKQRRSLSRYKIDLRRAKYVSLTACGYVYVPQWSCNDCHEAIKPDFGSISRYNDGLLTWRSCF